MPDWPVQYNTLPGTVIETSSMCSLVRDCILVDQLGASAAGVWPAANRAHYIPLLLETTVTVAQMAFNVSVQSGNYDVGIYDERGNRLVSKGSTAVPAAGLAAVDITDTTLTPGVYYMAMNVDNTTASIFRWTPPGSLLQMCGMQVQAVGAVTLPNPATFANPALGTNYMPDMICAMRATL